VTLKEGQQVQGGRSGMRLGASSVNSSWRVGDPVGPPVPTPPDLDAPDWSKRQELLRSCRLSIEDLAGSGKILHHKNAREEIFRETPQRTSAPRQAHPFRSSHGKAGLTAPGMEIRFF